MPSAHRTPPGGPSYDGPMPLRVAFIAAECEPWAKTGGSATSSTPSPAPSAGCRARSTARSTSSCRATGVCPFPHGTAAGAAGPCPRSASPGGATELTDRRRRGERLPAPARRPPGGVRSRRDLRPAGRRRLRRQRLALRAVLPGGARDASTEGERPVDIIHLHDWHAGPAAIQRDAWLGGRPRPRAGRRWSSPSTTSPTTAGPPRRAPPAGARAGRRRPPGRRRRVDLLRAGIVRVEMANTVSPGFAREALTPEGGFGLDDALRAKGDRYVGILNGLDTAVWDPATDADLAATYSAADLAGKAACRADLSSGSGSTRTDDGAGPRDDRPARPAEGLRPAGRRGAAAARRPVPGSWSRAAATDDLAAGCGRSRPSEPDRVALIERFDRAMARRIYAGADFFLMPSRFEPCGHGPDDRAALRDAADRPPDRRAGRHGRRRGRDPGRGNRLRLRRRDAGGARGACEAAMAMRAAGGACLGRAGGARDGRRLRLADRLGAARNLCSSGVKLRSMSGSRSRAVATLRRLRESFIQMNDANRALLADFMCADAAASFESLRALA